MYMKGYVHQSAQSRVVWVASIAWKIHCTLADMLVSHVSTTRDVNHFEMDPQNQYVLVLPPASCTT